jgi:hypothetical protein
MPEMLVRIERAGLSEDECRLVADIHFELPIMGATMCHPSAPEHPSSTGEAKALLRSIHAINSGSRNSGSDSASENASALAASKRETEASPAGGNVLRVFMFTSSEEIEECPPPTATDGNCSTGSIIL